jgi:hypothetical protein
MPRSYQGEIMPSPLRKQVLAISAALRRLEVQLHGLIPALAKESSGKRKLTLSRERRGALKLQGRYLGYMRQLKPTQKARVKALKAKKGMHAAIAMAKKLASK